VAVAGHHARLAIKWSFPKLRELTIRKAAFPRVELAELGSLVTLRWREMDSNYWYRGTKAVDFRSIPGIAGYWRARKRYHLMVQPLFFCALNHSIEPGWGTV